MHKITRGDVSLLRSKNLHDRHVTSTLNGNTTFRVMSDCPLNELGYWHMISNLAFDVVHDLFESW